jgi:hypothetical protein
LFRVEEAARKKKQVDTKIEKEKKVVVRDSELGLA